MTPTQLFVTSPRNDETAVDIDTTVYEVDEEGPVPDVSDPNDCGSDSTEQICCSNTSTGTSSNAAPTTTD